MRALRLGGPMLSDTAVEARARRILRGPDFGITYIATLALILTLRPPAYWIAFGPHGPRAEAPPGENVKIFMYVMAALGATGVIFGAARFFARGQPATMTKEYQEASNEYLKVCKTHEIHRDPRVQKRVHAQ